MFTLHGNPCSSNSRKVQWALEELGHPYRLQLVDIVQGEQKAPSFLARNPNGRIPVLEEDGFVLYESNAILRYLCEVPGRVELMPSERRARALVNQWLSWQEADMAPAFIGAFLTRFATLFGAPLDEATYQRHKAAADRLLPVLEAHLKGRRYMVGESFTLADLALGELVATSEDAGFDLAPHPHVRAWVTGLFERPAYRATRFHGGLFVQCMRIFAPKPQQAAGG